MKRWMFFGALLGSSLSFSGTRADFIEAMKAVDSSMVNNEGQTIQECCSDPQMLALLDNSQLEYKEEGFGPFVKIVDESQLEIIIRQCHMPLVVDFFASWCGPCKRMKPIYRKIAEKYKGKVIFVAIDIDRSKKLREKYNLRGVPSFNLYQTGKFIKQQYGSLSEDKFEELLNSTFELK
ncbi:MAG: thioredoxin family protein [Rhabdochlamydiaceae bacterium]|nr:thioredoxin family protein [Candidatus Amphrikana amoebophyrae]